MADQTRQRRSVLVCGGAGYVASHVVPALLEAGLTPVVVDDLSTGHRPAVSEGVQLHVGSVGDRPAMDEIFGRHDVAAVMHFCAHIDVGESVQDPRKYYHNNIANGLVLLEAMIDHGVRQLVFSSSCAVYGLPQRLPIDEDSPVVPISPYGRTKAMFEQILTDYECAYGLRWVALRYFNAAGAMPDGSIGEDHRPETHLIPLVLGQALRSAHPGTLPDGPPLQVFGNDYDTPDGTCIRDYVHVLDLASAHVRALDYLAAGETSAAMNLGNQTGCSVLEMIDACRQVTGQEINYKIAPRRPGDPPRLVAQADRALRSYPGGRNTPTSTPSSRPPGDGTATTLTDSGSDQPAARAEGRGPGRRAPITTSPPPWGTGPPDRRCLAGRPLARSRQQPQAVATFLRFPQGLSTRGIELPQ